MPKQLEPKQSGENAPSLANPPKEDHNEKESKKVESLDAGYPKSLSASFERVCQENGIAVQSPCANDPRLKGHVEGILRQVEMMNPLREKAVRKRSQRRGNTSAAEVEWRALAKTIREAIVEFNQQHLNIVRRLSPALKDSLSGRRQTSMRQGERMGSGPKTQSRLLRHRGIEPVSNAAASDKKSEHLAD